MPEVKLYGTEVKFPEGCLVELVGGHPNGSPLVTKGVLVNTIAPAEPGGDVVYLCEVLGDPKAVYPYTENGQRIVGQEHLTHHFRDGLCTSKRTMCGW